MVADEAILAATLILIRDRADGPPELLMVERAEGMAFAAGALVFPGGRIDQADIALAASLDANGAAVAAIRETLEETGIPAGLIPSPDEATARSIFRTRSSPMNPSPTFCCALTCGSIVRR